MARPIRLCMVTHLFPEDKADIRGIFLLELSRFLIRNGVAVHVVAPHSPGGKSEYELDGVKVHRFRYAWSSRLELLSLREWRGPLHEVVSQSFIKMLLGVSLLVSSFVKTMTVVKKYDIDVLQTEWILPSGIVGLVCKRLSGRPLVTRILGTDFMVLERSRILRRLCKAILLQSDMVLPMASAFLQELYNVGVPNSRVKFMPDGVDSDVYRPALKKKEQLIVLFVGTLIKGKGVNLLIRAAKKVIAKMRDVQFLIIGKGPELENLKNLSASLGLGSSVKFLGAIEHRKLVDYYQLCDVFVLPSYSEASPSVILEAMSCGRPVVATKVGGIPDIIYDGESGILIDAGDENQLANAISKLLEQEELRKRFGQIGRERVLKNFSYQILSKHLRDLYTSLVRVKS